MNNFKIKDIVEVEFDNKNDRIKGEVIKIKDGYLTISDGNHLYEIDVKYPKIKVLDKNIKKPIKNNSANNDIEKKGTLVSDGTHLYEVDSNALKNVNIDNGTNVETVNHPDHYLPGTYEAIKVIEAWMGKEACFNFCVANTLKYLARIDKKKDSSLDKNAKTIEDIKKASWYLNYALELKVKK